ncbi:IS3 family transposase [Saccharococcus caldoxylosilyticus]|uniref:IS3 family transposase n=1 Tax=Saccharococcus caldoxylosilyticus TaxID=81408 RepID=UPI0009DB5184
MAFQQRDQILKGHLLAVHRSRLFYGYPKIQAALRKEGFHANHNGVYRLMKGLNIQSVIRKNDDISKATVCDSP